MAERSDGRIEEIVQRKAHNDANGLEPCKPGDGRIEEILRRKAPNDANGLVGKLFEKVRNRKIVEHTL